jgi:hypothetical protein
MDEGTEPEQLLSVADTSEGWRLSFVIIRAFEREGGGSLAKPIELGGGSGPNGLSLARKQSVSKVTYQLTLTEQRRDSDLSEFELPAAASSPEGEEEQQDLEPGQDCAGSLAMTWEGLDSQENMPPRFCVDIAQKA